MIIIMQLNPLTILGSSLLRIFSLKMEIAAVKFSICFKLTAVGNVSKEGRKVAQGENQSITDSMFHN